MLPLELGAFVLGIHPGGDWGAAGLISANWFSDLTGEAREALADRRIHKTHDDISEHEARDVVQRNT